MDMCLVYLYLYSDMTAKKPALIPCICYVIICVFCVNVQCVKTA